MISGMAERAPRKADLVSRDLLRSIVRGDIAVGETLPKESELADSYGVNRSVVREAIKSLEVHRLVRPVRRRGTIVLDPMASISPEVLRALLIGADGTIDLDVLADLLELRAALDVEMGSLAARRRSPEDLAALADAVDALAASFDDPPAYSRALRAFAAALAAATHNRMFPMLIAWHEAVSADLGHLMEAVRRPSSPHLQGLRAFLELVAQGEVEAVRNIISAFHGWATPMLLEEARRRNHERRREAREQLVGANS